MAVIRLFPAYKDHLWGGEKLTTFYGKENATTPLAETWELSLHPDGISCLPDGRTLDSVLTPAMLGENVSRFASFPLLVKLIDAAKDLSVQVHPSDAYALCNEGSYGKTEMWYIIDADEGAGIYLGFCREVTEEEVRSAVEQNTLTELLKFYPVHAGECYFIPAGTVHAIGAGCLICEIQQNSNLTYRLYDYGRRDADGKTRTLHIEKALSVMQGTPYMPHLPPLPVDEEETLGFCPYFRVAKRTVKGDALVFADVASFRALIAIHGEGLIDGARTAAGDTYLIPAGERAMLSGDLVLLSVSVRRYRLKKADKNLLLTDDLGRIHAKGSAEDSDPKEFLSRYGLTLSDVNGIV